LKFINGNLETETVRGGWGNGGHMASTLISKTFEVYQMEIWKEENIFEGENKIITNAIECSNYLRTLFVF
jgi:hypothetical protein